MSPDRTQGADAAGPGEAVVDFDGACESTAIGVVAAYGFTATGPFGHHEGLGLAVAPGSERATNNVAEYSAAICALEWLARVPHHGRETVRGDSQLVIRQMTGEYAVRTEHLRPYHERLRQLCAHFDEVRFEWIPREENERADALSKQAVRQAVRSGETRSDRIPDDSRGGVPRPRARIGRDGPGGP